MEAVIPFHLLHPGTCLVDPIRTSGFSESGLYVVDQETDAASKTSMLCHVWAVHPQNKNKDVLGEVCVVGVYSWDDFTYDGEEYHIMHEDNIQAILKGYDD